MMEEVVSRFLPNESIFQRASIQMGEVWFRYRTSVAESPLISESVFVLLRKIIEFPREQILGNESISYLENRLPVCKTDDSSSDFTRIYNLSLSPPIPFNEKFYYAR